MALIAISALDTQLACVCNVSKLLTVLASRDLKKFRELILFWARNILRQVDCFLKSLLHMSGNLISIFTVLTLSPLSF